MEAVLDYHIPVLHPLAVHAPVVLVVVCALVTAWWFARDRSGALTAAIWLAAAGLASTLLARSTGEAMADQSAGTPIVELMLPAHELAANVTLGLSTALLLALLAARWSAARFDRHPGVPVWIRFGVVVIAAAAAIAVAWTAHVGGVMVWGVPD